MAKLTQETIAGVIQPFLEPGEQIHTSAYGAQQPSMLLVIPMLLLGLLPGLIASAMLTRYFIFALTDRRVLLLTCTSNRRVREVREFRPGNIPQVGLKQGKLFSTIQLNGPAGSFRIKFHRANMENNRENAVAIGSALTNQPLSA